jgi:hypothetical protein
MGPTVHALPPPPMSPTITVNTLPHPTPPPLPHHACLDLLAPPAEGRRLPRRPRVCLVDVFSSLLVAWIVIRPSCMNSKQARTLEPPGLLPSRPCRWPPAQPGHHRPGHRRPGPSCATHSPQQPEVHPAPADRPVRPPAGRLELRLPLVLLRGGGGGLRRLLACGHLLPRLGPPGHCRQPDPPTPSQLAPAPLLLLLGPPALPGQRDGVALRPAAPADQAAAPCRPLALLRCRGCCCCDCRRSRRAGARALRPPVLPGPQRRQQLNIAGQQRRRGRRGSDATLRLRRRPAHVHLLQQQLQPGAPACCRRPAAAIAQAAQLAHAVIVVLARLRSAAPLAARRAVVVGGGGGDQLPQVHHGQRVVVALGRACPASRAEACSAAGEGAEGCLAPGMRLRALQSRGASSSPIGTSQARCRPSHLNRAQPAGASRAAWAGTARGPAPAAAAAAALAACCAGLPAAAWLGPVPLPAPLRQVRGPALAAGFCVRPGCARSDAPWAGPARRPPRPPSCRSCWPPPRS